MEGGWLGRLLASRELTLVWTFPMYIVGDKVGKGDDPVTCRRESDGCIAQADEP